MSVTFRLPTNLRPCVGGRRDVQIETPAATVGDALRSLGQLYPGLLDRVLTETGELRQKVYIFVGNECTQCTGRLATALPPQAQVQIAPQGSPLGRAPYSLGALGASRGRMPAKELSPKPSGVVLMVGTTKGAYLLTSDFSRSKWQTSSPQLRGHSVYAMAYDGRNGRQRIWAAAQSFHFGAALRFTDDFGKTWSAPDTASIKFPSDAGVSLNQIWQIAIPKERPEMMYCGVEPAALFESRDAGQSWSLVRGLFDHRHRPRWEPGGGGLCLHTILPDPTNHQRMHVAISTGGVYRTDDGGKTWQSRNQGIRAEFLPDEYPEFGQCVHKIVHHPSAPERLFLQNHWGLYRSDDGGDSWRDVANDVPSDFGFAMVVHPHEPETVYIVPLESDEFRCVPEGKLRVYRSRNGARWEPLTRGLPQSEAFETVVRDAMSTDSLVPAGIYFGTRSGKLYGSANGGASWQLIAGCFPPITCVKAASLGPAPFPRPKPRRSRTGGTKRRARAVSRGIDVSHCKLPPHEVTET
ncbi:MAG TPA: hypothetical protein VKB87_24080 [Myxococcaceae bacterium]|nr:hypothetical protein [Myxococcaceae bacterium]